MAVDWVQPSALPLGSLAELLKGCGTRSIGSLTGSIDHITEDSREVRRGSLFVARKGQSFDGRRYVPDAIEKGAALVLCERGSEISAEPRIEVDNLPQAWGICAQALFANPSRKLRAVGVTGTNGKTTVASLVQQSLNFLGHKVGRLGTLGFFVDEEKLTDCLTTPQPDELALYLAQARRMGAGYVVLEVSSHALAQERVAGVHLEVAAFTNLTQDHLDFHGTIAAYGDAKARLFREMRPEHRVFNIDDVMGRNLALEFTEALTVSAEGAVQARIRVDSASCGRDGIEAQVQVDGEAFGLCSRLLGRYNLENILVAWGILRELGIPAQETVAALQAAVGVPGRMERVDSELDDIVVVVDYAHTPDALERALNALVELSFVELVCVFGCGGDRDRAKRAPMGAIAAKLSSTVYLTSDNPRSENPASILEEVRRGFGRENFGNVQQDRRLAIEESIGRARPGAVVLIAGKGHEDYQIVGSRRLDFDDRVEARKALLKRRAGANA